jgi:hypothetical protein
MWHVWGRGEMHALFSLKSLEGKKTLGRPGRRWKDNIKMDLTEICWRGMKDLAHTAHASDTH